jgi:hypothetical protein
MTVTSAALQLFLFVAVAILQEASWMGCRIPLTVKSNCDHHDALNLGATGRVKDAKCAIASRDDQCFTTSATAN